MLKSWGARLPTYEQILLCLMSNMDQDRKADETKNQRLMRKCANKVVEEALRHYVKCRIQTLAKHKMAEKIEGFYKEFRSLMKMNPERRKGNSKINEFQEKLKRTMPLWPRNLIKKIEDSKRGKAQHEKKAIDEDIHFLQSMMIDRVASYYGKDKKTAELEDKRLKRKIREGKKRQDEETQES